MITRKEQDNILQNQFVLKLNKNIKISKNNESSIKAIGFLMGLMALYLFIDFILLKLIIPLTLAMSSFARSIIESFVLKSSIVYFSFIIYMSMWVIVFLVLHLGFVGINKFFNTDTWLENVNPNFNPWLYFKGEELVVMNRDSSEYGIRYDLLKHLDLKIKIIDNYLNDKNEQMYKVQLTTKDQVLKEENVDRLKLSYMAQGFVLKQ